MSEVWRRVAPKALIAAGLLQGVLPHVAVQLDVPAQAGLGGRPPVVLLVAAGLWGCGGSCGGGASPPGSRRPRT